MHLKEFVRVIFSDTFDSVVTVFFLDTAHNVIAYIETIYDILKPGGYWVNLGNVTSIYISKLQKRERERDYILYK